MAERNKTKKPQPTSSGEANDPVFILFILFILVSAVGFLVERYFSSLALGETFLEAAYSLVSFVWPVSLFFSVLFAMGIVYCVKSLTKVKKELKLRFHSVQEDFISGPEGEKVINRKWMEILKKLESDDLSDWKLSILEADIILDEIVNKVGYKGYSLGEKLKNVEESDFHTIAKAQEAHKVRNTIAHEGADFFITQEEAKRIVRLYEEVFKEFKYI